MIGQKELILKLEKMESLPRFIILSGEKGCGKKTFAKLISLKFNMPIIFIEPKIDEIRNMIALANNSLLGLIFYIDDGDKMSLGAKNTLLKITEEAPNNAHIILSTENKEIVLPTLLSRAETISFYTYLKDDYKKFCEELNIEYNEIFLTVCPNLSYLIDADMEQLNNLYLFANKVIDEIEFASGTNAFKILDKIKLRDSENGFDFKQFLYAIGCVAFNRYVSTNNKDDMHKFFSYIKSITNAKRLLANPILSKQYIADELILNLKGIKRD